MTGTDSRGALLFVLSGFLILIIAGSLIFHQTRIQPAGSHLYTIETQPSYAEAQTSSAFSIFWITDTQHLSNYYPQKFINLTTWMKNNANYYHVEMIVHTGDLVDTPNALPQWDAANTAMSLLLNYTIPYCWCAGNHDQLPTYNPNTDWIGSRYIAFNPQVMEQRNYWLSDINDGKDTAVHFYFNNIEFIIINIEYHANSTTLAWANNLIDDHPNAYVILATHSYLDPTLNYDEPWANTLNSTVLTAHPNVLMTLNGHFHTDSAVHTKMGNINEIMFDRQETYDTQPNDGAATITILSFNTLLNQITVKTFNINTGRFFTDANNQFTMSTKFPPSNGTHNVELTKASIAKTIVGRGYPITIDVTVSNLGDFPESVDVSTRFINSTQQIQTTQTLDLDNIKSRTTQETSLVCNTTGLAYSYYTIEEYLSPVPFEQNQTHTNYTVGDITITIPGDINGDFKVKLVDLVMFANAYGSTPGRLKWNPNADIDNNNTVGLSDLVILAKNYQ